MNGIDQKRLEIARHETGHAVVALLCGQKIQKISLRGMTSPHGTVDYHAFVSLEPGDSKLTVASAIGRVRIALGGFASRPF